MCNFSIRSVPNIIECNLIKGHSIKLDWISWSTLCINNLPAKHRVAEWSHFYVSSGYLHQSWLSSRVVRLPPISWCHVPQITLASQAFKTSSLPFQPSSCTGRHHHHHQAVLSWEGGQGPHQAQPAMFGADHYFVSGKELTFSLV